MANIYFGPEDPQLGPLPSPGQADWNTVNPPEVLAAAKAMADRGREAEQQRALEASMGRFVTMGNRAEWVPYGEMADTQKAIASARQFQGARMYAQAVASGMPREQALARFGADMFAGRPADMAKALQPGKPISIGGVGYMQQADGSLKAVTPERTWQERTINGNTVLTSEGNIRVIPPARDRALESLEAEERRLKTTTQAAAREAEALTGAVRTEIKPPVFMSSWPVVGGLFRQTPLTNQNPLVDPKDIAVAQGKASAASNQLAQASEAVRAHLASQRGPVTATNVAPIAPVQAKPIQEVIRVTRDGKRAVFDAATKQFLRYAD